MARVRFAAMQMQCVRDREADIARAASLVRRALLIRDSETLLAAGSGPDEVRAPRVYRGVFRDRRPALYGRLPGN
jgi:hypothetical protein